MYIRLTLGGVLSSPTSRYSKKRVTNGYSSKPNPINKPQILSAYSSPVSSLYVIVHSNLSPSEASARNLGIAMDEALTRRPMKDVMNELYRLNNGVNSDNKLGIIIAEIRKM